MVLGWFLTKTIWLFNMVSFVWAQDSSYSFDDGKSVDSIYSKENMALEVYQKEIVLKYLEWVR